MTNTDNLKNMLKIFKPNGNDWMNFSLSRKNPYTFHHIVPKSDGGEDTIENGAILTRKAHDLIHILELACPDAYDDLKKVFLKINESKKPISVDMLDEVDEILYDVFTGDYNFIIDIDLSSYKKSYYRHDKKEGKRIKK